MSAEHKPGRVEKGGRALLAGLSLLLAPDSGPPPASQFGQVKRVEAAGLVRGQEQDADLPKGRIIYTSFKDNNPDSFDDDEEDIYIADLDGGNPEKLTKKKRRDRDPRVMPDGRVVFASLSMNVSAKEQDHIVIIDPKTKKEEVIFSAKSGEALPLCPAPDKDGGVVFNLFADQPVADIYSVGKDGKVEQLTKDNIGSTEACPVVSPDGRFIAFEVSVPGRHGLPSGIAIYERASLPDGFKPPNHPVLIEGGRTYQWVDSEHIIYTKGSSLYKARWDGTEVNSLATNTPGGASISPDGKWIIFAKTDERKNANLYIVSSSGGTPIRLWETSEHLYSPQWLSTITGRKQIALVPGMLNFIKDRIDKNGGFSPLRERLIEEDFGFRHPDFFVSGYMGGYFDERGYYYTKDQTCEDTLQGIESAAKNEAEMVLGWLKANPNDELVIVAHSLGGPVMLRAFELIRTQNPNINLSRVKLITAHSPNQGIDKRPLELLNTILPPGLPNDCYINTPIGRTPPPQVFDYPTLRSLLEMWDQRGETQKRWQKLTAWMKSRGGQVFALANYYDCVIALEMCASLEYVGQWTWDIIMPWYLSWVQDPSFWATLPSVLWSQEIPGAVNIWRALGNDSDLGHTKYLNEGEGLETLAAVIGKQNK